MEDREALLLVAKPGFLCPLAGILNTCNRQFYAIRFVLK